MTFGETKLYANFKDLYRSILQLLSSSPLLGLNTFEVFPSVLIFSNVYV